MGETETLLLGGLTQGLVCTRTQGKSRSGPGSYEVTTCGSWKGSLEVGVGFGSLWGHRHWWQAYWATFNHMNNPGG